MNSKKEEIIDVEFSVVDDDRTTGFTEKYIWILVGENVIDSKLAKISWRIFNHDGRNDKDVNCYVSQIESVDIKNAFRCGVFNSFDKVPTKEEQRKMVKDALAKHQLQEEIWVVGERYAQGHLSALKIQKCIKGGAYVSV